METIEKKIYQIPLEKQHTIYKDKNGKILYGTTTVLNILAKPALYQWYYKMGKEGINPFKKKDTAGDIGTIAHALIMCHLKGWELDKSNLPPQNVSIAENCVISYFEWEKGKTIKPLLIEQELIDEVLGYGGTIDLYGEIDKELCLIDFKTSSGIYKDMWYQVAGYRNLLQKNKYQVDKVTILNIGKDENSDFAMKSLKNTDIQFEIFKNCLNTYKLQKEEK